ncbi:MAG: peptidoglycan-associated lipoprotein Pal [Desulfovermiculus sp.]|nr:peptidoglycan-associated lipoprotein Pal [Desulfovermiculus sp.]
MRTYAWTLTLGVCLVIMIFAMQGCARKSVSDGSETLAAEQRGEYQAEDSLDEGGKEATSDMTAEEMEEFGLQEKERREASKREKAQQEEKRKQATQELGQRIHFAFDSYELRVQARQELKNKAEIMDRFPEIEVVIEGHCDERGTDEYNLALGERRARAAYEFLVLLGIDPDRLRIISYGEERPLEQGNDEAAWAKNRRCEFRVVE